METVTVRVSSLRRPPCQCVKEPTVLTARPPGLPLNDLDFRDDEEMLFFTFGVANVYRIGFITELMGRANTAIQTAKSPGCL